MQVKSKKEIYDIAMYEITQKKLLAPNIYYMEVYAPRVAASALPGQFVIVRTGELGERIPLTVVDYDREKGTVAIVVQIVGASSRKICALEQNDCFTDFVGPLGHPSEFVHESDEELRSKKRLFIAGGVGAAPVYPQVKWLRERGASADVIIGGKTQDFILLEKEMEVLGATLHIATDDGSRGYHGLVTGLFKQLMDSGARFDQVIAIGPMIMMKFAALATKEYGIPTIASLNSMMVDGTGMCGACRVTVGGKVRFTCVDGPEFDAHQVDFDLAMRRGAMFREEEKERDCRCMEQLADKAANNQ